MIAVHPFTLPNGLSCLHLEDPGARAASVQVWYRVGSAHETPETFGLAHLLEHLSFKGTAAVGPEEHMRLIQKAGGQANAFTSEEVTVMHQTLPAGDADLALRLEADRMENLTLDPDLFERERAVVLEEYKERIENQPLSAAVSRARTALLGDHPYAHDPAGTRESLAALTVDRARAFYASHYHPRNAVLVLAGPFGPAEAREMVERWFGPVKKGGEPPPPPPPFPASPPSRLCEAIPVKASAHALISFFPRDPSLYHALQVLQAYLGDGENALLKKALQEKKFWVLHAGALFYPALCGYAFVFYSLRYPHFPDGGLPALARRLLERTAHEGLPPARLEQLKGRAAIAHLGSLTGSEKKALRLGECAVLRGDAGLFFDDARRFEALTDSDLRRAAGTVLNAPRAEVLMRGSLWKRS